MTIEIQVKNLKGSIDSLEKYMDNDSVTGIMFGYFDVYEPEEHEIKYKGNKILLSYEDDEDPKDQFKKIKDFNARRAETRQALVSLKCINQKPLHPLKFMFDTEEEIRNFIKTLPWNDNPWHSGSHTSHLVIFLETNFKLKRE